jgi:hypothetical protein
MAIGDVYKKIDGSWAAQGNIRGATGATGETGPAGAAGATGAAGLDGADGEDGAAGAPGSVWYAGASATGGENGDFFLITE